MSSDASALTADHCIRLTFCSYTMSRAQQIIDRIFLQESDSHLALSPRERKQILSIVNTALENRSTKEEFFAAARTAAGLIVGNEGLADARDLDIARQLLRDDAPMPDLGTSPQDTLWKMLLCAMRSLSPDAALSLLTLPTFKALEVPHPPR